MESSQEKAPRVIKCKAAVSWSVGEPVVIEEIEVYPPKKEEVRLKMLCASLCHTDIAWGNGFPIPLFPRVLGHEGVGVVESVGEGVSHLKEGDMVIPTYVSECHDCENCVSGVTNLCLTNPFLLTGLMHDGTSRMTVGGKMLYHMFACSTWSEYTVLNANFAVKVDPSMDLCHASLISCGFATGYGAAWKEANITQGSSVAVFGLGAVGLGVVEGARANGATKIIGIDLQDSKKKIGEICGITDFINPSQINEKPIWEAIQDLTGGLGVDSALDCTGAPGILNQALTSTKMGLGRAIQVGSGFGLETSVNPVTLMGRTIKGTIYGGLRPKSDLPVLLARCSSGELKFDHFITHQIPFEKMGKAMQLVKQPDCVKVFIDFD